MAGVIIDLSHHQDPAKIDYNKLSQHIVHAIVRTQDGIKTLDRHYRTHHAKLRENGIPTASYAFVRGRSIAEMREEARLFYERTKDINPSFWWLDVELKTMTSMRTGVKAYVQELRERGAKRVGIYIAHHLYTSLDIDMDDFDAVWIPRYGRNTGVPDVRPNYPCDLWQYTSKGRLPGYDGYLDLNLIISDKPLSFFTGMHEDGPFRDVPADHWAADAIRAVRDAGLMSGRPDGTFGPNEPVTRAQFAAVLARLLNK